MKYNVGMYGGSFDPVHLGHLSNIIKAAAQCGELYVVISFCQGRDSVPKELRYRWLLNTTRHLPNVKLLLVEDGAASKDEYNTMDYWEKGAQDIKRQIGRPIDAVFCGSDYRHTGRFEGLYPESEVVYFDRSEIPVSSTQIRAQPYKYWQYIPAVCRDYYARKVLIVGGESTGKSTLVQNLALAYNTNFVSEVGRDTTEYAGGEDLLIADDLYENLLRQRIHIMDAAKQSNRLLFVDTDALTTLFYADLLLTDPKAKAAAEMLAKAIHHITRWDLVIFLKPDVPFVQDGTRNEQIHERREWYSRRLQSHFEAQGVPFYEIDGDYLARFEKSKALIADLLHITM